MLTTYLQTLTQAAAEAGVDLQAATRKAGIADTTLSRWRAGHSCPRFQTADRVMKEIKELGLVEQRAKSANLARSRRSARR